MKKLGKLLLNIFAGYYIVGLLFATCMCIAAKEFNIVAFLLMTVIWPLVVAFWLAFHLSGT